MPAHAYNFAQRTKHVWASQSKISPGPNNSTIFAFGRAEENAVIRAKRLGAIQIGPVAHGGDIPASLWKFKDNSEYCIFDDGSGIFPARKHGRRKQ